MATFSAFPDPGGSRSTALDTRSASYIGGSLSTTPNTFQNSVSSSDISDYYKFQVSSSSLVSLDLDGLTGDASLQLYPETGSVLQTADSSGTTSELITRTLDPGIYYVRVASVSGASTNYDLTLVTYSIQESGNSDNALATALNIGTLTSYTTTDFVGNRGVVTDTNDYYQFNVANSGTFNLTLNGLVGNGNVELYNNSGTVIASSTQADTNSESISRVLTSGTYYVRVFPSGSGAATNYNLDLSFSADPPDNAGNTLGTANNIDPFTSPTISDFVNSADPNDYYRFDLTSNTLINFTLTPTTANADVQLLNSSGGIISSSTQTGTTPDSINRSLNAGTYYIRVFPISGAATNYNLSVSATAIGTDIAPNTLNTANNIGNLNGSQNYSDFVGNIDTVDYYKFTLTYNGDFSLNLSGLTGNADVELLYNNGSLVQSSTQAGNSDENINTTLAAGTYYIKINSIGSANTFYNLSLFAEYQAQILQISPGGGSSDPDNLTVLNGTLYFTANDGTNGVQLWKSDGVTNTRLTTINSSNFNPDNLTAFGNKLVFTANNGTNGTELWMYDGTTAQILTDINVGSGSSAPSNLTVVGNNLFFTANDGIHGRELWVYNGNTVSLVKDIYSGASSSNASSLVGFNNKLYFAANNGVNGTELWSSDGTTTSLVTDIYAGAFSSSPTELTVAGSRLYFTADNGTNGVELWMNDGTTTSRLTNLDSVFGPTYLTAVGNTLFFVTDSDGDFEQELWKSDGIVTVPMNANLAEAPNIGFGPIYLTAIDDSLLAFTTYDPNIGFELWLTDGNQFFVNDIWSGTDSSIPDSFVLFGDTLYFAASESTNGRELWKLDSPVSVPSRVSDINPGVGDANPANLTVVGNKLFFTANDGTNGTELWVMTEEVMSIT
ncbi:ELWxxDGT repeat protein [Pelatocladus sp. BLCC-F211]|uniref:ELWxxDGT repeat protein n=1 Tax=Pelatocladus sp. BLCC-F211 TaxID=3342752 RepID=UPI0035BB4F23